VGDAAGLQKSGHGLTISFLKLSKGGRQACSFRQRSHRQLNHALIIGDPLGLPAKPFVQAGNQMIRHPPQPAAELFNFHTT